MVKKHNNKGFSMIEMIVTIAILAVITGAAVSIFSWIRNNRIRSMAGNVNTVISDTRSKTLTKGGSFELVIKRDTDSSIIAEIYSSNAGDPTSPIDTKKISSKDGDITVESSGTEYHVNSSYELHISFNKADGAFKEMAVYSTSGSSTSGMNFDGEIKVSYAGLDRTIKLIELTGKHYIE